MEKLLEKILDIFDRFLETLTTEAGIVATAFFVFCVYLAWSLYDEKKAHRATIEKYMDNQEKTFEHINDSNIILTGLKATLETVQQFLFGNSAGKSK